MQFAIFTEIIMKKIIILLLMSGCAYAPQRYITNPNQTAEQKAYAPQGYITNPNQTTEQNARDEAACGMEAMEHTSLTNIDTLQVEMAKMELIKNLCLKSKGFIYISPDSSEGALVRNCNKLTGDAYWECFNRNTKKSVSVR